MSLVSLATEAAGGGRALAGAARGQSSLKLSLSTEGSRATNAALSGHPRNSGVSGPVLTWVARLVRVYELCKNVT